MVYFICQCSFVFDLKFVFILFRVTWWPSAGNQLSSWLSAHVAFICRLSCISSFPARCVGQDVEFDCIGS